MTCAGHLPCIRFTIGPAPRDREKKMLEIKLILCFVDFSEFSVRAYRHARSVAQHYRAHLVVLHIVELWRCPSLSFVPAGAAYAHARQ
jgi:hypothetical protein